MKKFFACAIIVSAVATLSYAASEQEAGAETVTITAFAAADASTIQHYNEIDAIFNEKFPNIRIEWQPQAAEGIEEKFISLYVTGQSPDLFVDDTERLLPPEHRYQVFENLQPWVDKDPELQDALSTMLPGVIDGVHTGERLYGLPTHYAALVLFARESWMDQLGLELPRDWAEMRDMATAFQNQDPDGNGKDDTVGYYMMLWPGVSNLLTAITWWSAAGYNENRYGDSPEPTFNNPGQRAVIAEMRDWVHKYKIVNADALAVNAGNLYDAMNAGRVGIGRLGNWNVNRFDGNVDADYVPFLFPPQTQDQTAPNYAPYFQHAISLVRDSDHKAEALEYMKVFISKEAQELRYEFSGAVARTDLDFDALEDNPRRKFFLDTPMATTPYWPPHPWASIYRSVLQTSLDKVFADPNLDIEQEFSAAVDEIMTELKAEGYIK